MDCTVNYVDHISCEPSDRHGRRAPFLLFALAATVSLVAFTARIAGEAAPRGVEHRPPLTTKSAQPLPREWVWQTKTHDFDAMFRRKGLD